MRIISGRHKGRKITAPKKLPVRPTTDMSKEALFNILNNRFHFNDLVVVDLFAGTGNVSYEFGSRGAGPITAVDEDLDCIKFITKTTAELDLDISAVKSDVFKYLEKASIKADIIFADPPYNFEEALFSKIIELVFEKKCLNEGGVLILEHSKRTLLTSFPNHSESRKYGNSVFSFFMATLEDDDDEKSPEIS